MHAAPEPRGQQESIAGEEAGVRADLRARTRAYVALVSTVFTVGFACVCAQTAGSDGRTAAWLSTLNLAGFAGFAVRRGDQALGKLLLAAVFFGWAELLADALCVRCTGTLDYSAAGSALILASPWWMPLLWTVVAVQLGVAGDAFVQRFGVARGALLTGAAGAVLVPFYEQMAWGAHWWRYRDCLLLAHVPAYIVVAEAVIGVGLALLGHLVLRGGSWLAAVLLGTAAGAGTIFGGVVGWGTVEFLGRGARPLWPLP